MLFFLWWRWICALWRRDLWFCHRCRWFGILLQRIVRRKVFIIVVCHYYSSEERLPDLNFFKLIKILMNDIMIFTLKCSVGLVMPEYKMNYFWLQLPNICDPSHRNIRCCRHLHVSLFKFILRCKNCNSYYLHF